MTLKKVPELQNIEEMGRFWDTHDSMEFERGEIEAVTYKPKRLSISVSFDPGDMIELSRMARQLGLDRSSLVRFVVKQFLHREPEGQGPAETSATAAR